MSQKTLLIIVLILIIGLFGGIVVYDMKTNNKFGLATDKPNENWKWEDNWSSHDQKQPLPKNNLNQITANNYQEALKKSGELGKPILVFFTADWCVWCKKMKSETLTDAKVVYLMKNYIFVYVDTDKERDIARKFNIEGLPSYVITNYKEDKIKTGSGFKTGAIFADWLNDQSLYIQPKQDSPSSPKEEEPKKEKPKDKRRPKKDLDDCES